MDKMLPQKFKTMFGIKDEQDLKMANNIWKMLDQMSSNDPQAYEKFVEKNLREGFTDAKAQKQKKQKPLKLVPVQYMLLEMQAQLEEEYSGKQVQPEFKQKLDMNINKQKWPDIKAKFPQKIHLWLNICHTDRVKNPTSKSKNGQQIKQFNISMIKDIENLYYSIQGPVFDEKDKNKPEDTNTKSPNWYFCIIFNSGFVKSFDIVPNGRSILLGLSVAYFQERIKADRNPILTKVNTHALYGKNLFYGIQKATIQVNQNKKFKYGKQQKAGQFLLEKQVDIKQHQIKKEQASTVDIQKNKNGQPIKKQILVKPKQEQAKNEAQLPSLLPTQAPPKKKVLIQVLDEKETTDPKLDTQISYQMKQTEEGYVFEFLVHGIDKIDNLDLQVSSDTLNLKTLKPNAEGLSRSAEIKLKKKIDQNKVKAKMKKKTHILQVTLSF